MALQLSIVSLGYKKVIFIAPLKEHQTFCQEKKAPLKEQMKSPRRLPCSPPFSSGDMKTAINVVGSRIRKIRDQKGLSQEQMAAKCQILGFDLTRGTLAKIESGIRGVADHEIPFLARVLDTSIESLFPPAPVAIHRKPRFKGGRK